MCKQKTQTHPWLISLNKGRGKKAMAYIKVDHSQFEAAASAVDSYVRVLKNKMSSAQGEVNALSASWQGADFSQFRSEFDRVDNSDSTHAQLIKSLESYAKYLRYAAEKYKGAQARAVNLANNLPKW